jgi:membrane-bound transcription factor site-1 protease
LTESFNCFDASNYKVLLVIDPEDFFSQLEIQKVREDFEHKGLSLVILADWYN